MESFLSCFQFNKRISVHVRTSVYIHYNEKVKMIYIVTVIYKNMFRNLQTKSIVVWPSQNQESD